MPLFSSTTTSFRDGVKDLDSSRFKHLEKLIVPGKAIGRAPELAGTTVVFLPYPDFENPNYKKELAVLPDRLSDDPMDYGQWLFYADGVSRFGKNAVTILFDDPDDSNYIATEHNPVWMIYNAVERAVFAGQVIETPFGSSVSDNWEVLLKGDRKNRVFPVISRPDQLVMANALIYSSGKKAYAMEGAALGSADTDLQVVFVMGRYMVTKTMVPQLDAPGPDGTPLIKDITGVKFVHFYDRQKNDCQAMRNAFSAASTGFGGHRRPVGSIPGAEQAGATLAGYGVFLSDTANGLPTEQKLRRQDVIRLAVNKVKPWQQVLRGHTPEAAARLIATCGLPLSILYYAWKSMPEYYGDEIQFHLRNPRTVEMTPPAARTAPPAAAPTRPTAPLAAETTFMYGTPGELDEAVDPGAAPWGGHITDGAANAADDRGDDGGPPDADGDAAYDQAAVAAAQAKFKEFQAKQAKQATDGASAARSQAPKTFKR